MILKMAIRHSILDILELPLVFVAVWMVGSLDPVS